jgi:hypothetical protein
MYTAEGNEGMSKNDDKTEDDGMMMMTMTG